MKPNFYINGVNSANYGIVLQGAAIYNAPERDVTLIEVPGRNGALTIDNGRFKNVIVQYPVAILGELKTTAIAANAWLMSHKGYAKLSDDLTPNHYRLARCVGGFDVEAAGYAEKAATATIRFDCMPQRFLNSGDTAVEITASGYTLTNPTLYDALPLIKVEGSGNITMSVGGYIVGITGLTSSVTIDCELQDAYNGSQNMNSIISVLNYPKLGAGDNVVGWTGSVTKVAITPRWWTV